MWDAAGGMTHMAVCALPSSSGAVDLEKVDNPVERAAIEAQIREFGQTPKQVFAGPHPRR